MHLLAQISARTFTRTCLLVSGLWLLLLYPGIVWIFPNLLPREMKNNPVDFYQYYSGAVVVRYGIWDSLYPIPKADVYDGPNHFKPYYNTTLFDPIATSRNPAFYPPLNLPEASNCSPALVSHFPQITNHYRYIYPPPTALLLWPLSFFNFDFAASHLWPTLSMWALFVAALFASRIHRLFRKDDSYTEGLILLACSIFSLRGGLTHIDAANVTPMLSALLAVSVYSLLRGRQLAFTCAYVPLLLFKSIGLAWLPLLFLNRAYWRTLVYLAVISALLNGIVLALAGGAVYERFFSLASKITVPHGDGLVPTLIANFGFYPRTFYLIVYCACLGFLYYGYLRNSAGQGLKNSFDLTPLPSVAVLAGTMSLFCLLNFSVLIFYTPNYLYFPFIGWILWEGYSSTRPWRSFIIGGIAVSFVLMSCDWMVRLVLAYGLKSENASWYFMRWGQLFYDVLIPLFYLIVAYKRLLFETVPAADAGQDEAASPSRAH